MSPTRAAVPTGTEQLRAEVQLYERAMDRTARLLDLLVKSGLEERRVALDEERGALVAGALTAIFVRLQLSPEQQALIPVVVPEELRRLGGQPLVRGEVTRE